MSSNGSNSPLGHNAGGPPPLDIDSLQQRLREAEETLSAIRGGEVDAVVTSGPAGDQVYALRSAEHLYRLFVENMQEGAVTLDKRGTILYCNARFADIVEMALPRVVGAPIESFLTSADQSALRSALSLAADTPVKIELSLLSSSGKGVPAYLSLRAFADETFSGISMVVTDLTERHAARTAAEARDAAQAASAAKDQFLAALSHELRTPLTPALIAVDTLRNDQRLPKDVLDDLAMVSRNVHLQARLIDDLLDLTRITSGKLRLNSERVEVCSLVKSAVDVCQTEAQDKHLVVKLDLACPSPVVQCDPARLQQVFWNLLKNAIKFTPAGGTVDVRCCADEARNGRDGNGAHAEQGRNVIVQIQDSGIGIEPTNLPRLFQAFEQGTDAVTQRFGGLGMGLAICKALVEMHGGTVEAVSAGANRGATFTVTLPSAASPLIPTPKGPAAFDGDAPATSTSLRILLIEDHPDTARLMARLLSHDGHDVTTAYHVQGALRAAGSKQFDLVISDIGLPDGSGLDLMRQLKQQYDLRGIALTGYGMESDVAAAKAAGFQDHLTKPINLELLKQAINRLRV